MYNWSIIGFVKRVKKSFSIIVATVGVASFLDLTKKKKKRLTNRNFKEDP